MADSQETNAHGSSSTGEKVVIKKYANRRLYNTASSSYVTLEHLSEMVKQGVDFVVYDAKTNEDITRTVLTQIIFEEESQGQSLLPIQFLRQLIGFYGNSMQAFLPSYLELSLSSFTQQQERLRTQLSSLGQTVGQTGGVANYEEQIRQNLQLFDRAMKMFSPFAYVPNTATRNEEPTPAAPATKGDTGGDESLTLLRKQMAEMQAQLDKLAKG
ncbi:MAG: polyhydroxyalkanoate synthesis repressor PhaR [Alphaproteobacteria bacterium]|nr:polyhydroxyalkanoate synthesis repressor PhaR [Alphaproteobacteria bacterium]MBU1514581.1 polyhydroxyalkanoate synthesis repressor PhaR [Alphaproteobacteria bacterium]MBU2096787.1 polyhydroxyalkanoate synthesis repressor PhaR [Alphaproteobacteria bacterium]MBU2152489.1 polyhydroxyalkanoate synthesis repressor PhaR [Alphaproteobacteria bacterium]MBU2306580.1 polyhydroxyalkanoate synthesis repressor PhaR [Alphaproteobacteria bacterium]